MYTDNAVGNVVAETGRDGGTTTRLSDRSMPFPLCASPLKGEALGFEETTVLCFLPSWSTLLFERELGEEGRFDVASRSETPNSPKDQLSKPQTATVATAQWPSTYPNNPGERTASTEQISKKGIKLILKTIGNRKGDCA